MGSPSRLGGQQHLSVVPVMNGLDGRASSNGNGLSL